MNENKVQIMLSREILNRMNDIGALSVLKNILYDSDNSINWDKAYWLMMNYMPELKIYDGYKEENMQ